MKNNITLFAFVFFLLTSNYLFAQKNNVIKVQGEAIVREVPEIMNVSIPLDAKDSVYEQCSAKLVKAYNALKKALIQTGIKDESIKTSNIHISAAYKFVDRERKPDGYTGNMDVTVKLDYSDKILNEIIKALKSNSFQFGYTISFELSEEQKDTLLAKAIELAVKDAENKAQLLAKSVKVKLGSIKEVNFDYISVSNNILTRNKQVFYSLAEKENIQDLEINPQLLSISKSVGVIWEIEQ